jgi:hypothetical protein
MIVRIYACFGAIMAILMGLVWLGDNSVFQHDAINGILALILGGFGLIYIIIDSIRRYYKKKGVTKHV